MSDETTMTTRVPIELVERATRIAIAMTRRTGVRVRSYDVLATAARQGLEAIELQNREAA